MAQIKVGDPVRVVDRDPKAADVKSALYFSHYRGLTGKVFKIYGSGDTAEVAIEVDIESLPEDVVVRHLAARDQMREKLPAEAKKACAPGTEHEFNIRYIILVAPADVTRRTLPPVADTASIAPAAPTNGRGRKAA